MCVSGGGGGEGVCVCVGGGKTSFNLSTAGSKANHWPNILLLVHRPSLSNTTIWFTVDSHTTHGPGAELKYYSRSIAHLLHQHLQHQNQSAWAPYSNLNFTNACKELVLASLTPGEESLVPCFQLKLKAKFGPRPSWLLNTEAN